MATIWAVSLPNRMLRPRSVSTTGVARHLRLRGLPTPSPKSRCPEDSHEIMMGPNGPGRAGPFEAQFGSRRFLHNSPPVLGSVACISQVDTHLTYGRQSI